MLFKTTLTIWTKENPSKATDEGLVHQVYRGTAVITRSLEEVENPPTDPDWTDIAEILLPPRDKLTE